MAKQRQSRAQCNREISSSFPTRPIVDYGDRPVDIRVGENGGLTYVACADD